MVWQTRMPKPRSYDRKTIDIYEVLSIIYSDGGDHVGSQSSAADIQAYLHSAKQLISNGKYDFVTRRKNMQALAQHGLTVADAKAEILSLVVSDYYSGPKQDNDPNRTGDVWEFKKNISGNQFYVKTKIVQENGNYILKCLSFHEDEFI